MGKTDLTVGQVITADHSGKKGKIVELDKFHNSDSDDHCMIESMEEGLLKGCKFPIPYDNIREILKGGKI